MVQPLHRHVESVRGDRGVGQLGQQPARYRTGVLVVDLVLKAGPEALCDRSDLPLGGYVFGTVLQWTGISTIMWKLL